MSTLNRTPLYAKHAAAGARFVDFGGWEMPVQYQGIAAEHQAVRTGVGLFDVSHMGQIDVRGPGALEAVNALITNDLAAIKDGQALYTCLCREDGGILDDLVVYRYDLDHIFICCNAGNRAKVAGWFATHLGGAGSGLTVADQSDAFALLAVQGPQAVALVAGLAEGLPAGTDVRSIGRYHFAEGTVAGIPTIFSRTGYTGEDGFELYVPAAQAEALWDALFAAEPGLVPVGLGARDTLRLEMKFALYGNDIDEGTTPLEAGLAWVTKLHKADFMGKAALLAQREAGVPRRLVAVRLDGKAIARHGYPVVDAAGAQIGVVTSGAPSPSLGYPIAMAYVPDGQHALGSRVSIQVRNRVETGTIVKAPFYVPNASV
jgi:aminomethyltransferase